MSNLWYIVAGIFVTLWIIGYYSLSAGSLIHVFLILAIVSVLIKVLQSKQA